MIGDGQLDALVFGEDASVDELADGNEGAFGELCRQVLLRSLDQHWVDHLVAMGHLRQVMGLRGLAQRDPLVEYKSEAFDSFDDPVRGGVC